jgi:hypothetical protein
MSKGAWHGDAELKARIVARMKQHQKDDEFIKGVYQLIDPEAAAGYRGCAVGCALDRQPHYLDDLVMDPEHGWHEELERQFGIPFGLGMLIDDIFETLDPPANGQFAVDILDAIPVGAVLSSDIEDQVEGCYDHAAAVRSAAELLAVVKAAPLAEAVPDAH